MNLHHDKDAFEELVTAASVELKIPAPIIEKDYYVTLALKELTAHIKDMVFKGGTSLTKCYQLLDRFSEDIDISYDACAGTPGESRKRQLKKAVTETMGTLGFPITNLDQTRSRRSYNCYHAEYSSMYVPTAALKSELIIETYVALLPFPTVIRMADNYIYRFLSQSGLTHIAEEFGLMPFPVTTQAIERTLIDKVFALCDYYMEGKVERHSRHLYDIHRILENINIPESLPELIREVRTLRAPLPICPSAADGVKINELLEEIVAKAVYKEDYEKITKNLLFTPLSYETAVSSIRLLIDDHYFE